MQEVRGGVWFAQTDQTSQIAECLGAQGLFAPAESRWYGAFASGNALISHLPIKWWYRTPLPRTYDRSHRNLVLASVEHRGQAFRVLLTHIVRRDERERVAQLAAVIPLFLSLQPPALLLGDLNTTADDPHIQRLLATPGVEDPLAHRVQLRTAERVDWILARGFRTVDAGLIDRGASDHPLVWAELEIVSGPADDEAIGGGGPVQRDASPLEAARLASSEPRDRPPSAPKLGLFQGVSSGGRLCSGSR